MSAISATIPSNAADSLATVSRALVQGVNTQGKSPTPKAVKPALTPRPNNRRGVREMSFQSRGNVFRERFASVLQAVVMAGRYQHKHLARMTGATTKSVANWLSGNNAPAAEHLITLMREEDEIFFAVLAMAERLPEGLTEEQRFHLLQALKLLQEKA